ncbi:putative ankyrin repeat protein [Paramyrothecium foliicola]|nr:putative ankyrin repeat protein [Paramyrothecium foliicola]
MAMQGAGWPASLPGHATTPPQPLPEDIRTAIICALPLEYDAVCLVLDYIWDDNGVQNTYRIGRVGQVNVVLALLSGMGKASAASTSGSMLLNYRNLRVAFLVGICGGVPRYGDMEILLGDVVVSKAIVQYDFGRQYPDKFQTKNGFENNTAKPDKDVRNMLIMLETASERQRLQHQTVSILGQIQAKAKQQQYGPSYIYPGDTEDKLFQPDYRHAHHNSPSCICRTYSTSLDPVCDDAVNSSCDRSFGSGDTVVKSGEHRDKIANSHSLLAFEMEGAGVAEVIPCVIIKVVCDYADCHKNKKWQTFAAGTSASVFKAIIERYPAIFSRSITSEAKKTRLHTFQPSGSNQPSKILSNLKNVDEEERELCKEIQELLYFDQIDSRLLSLQAAHHKTCEWFLYQSFYRSWINKQDLRDHHGFLWIKGKPGAGKSILVKYLYSQAQAESRGKPEMLITSFFFNARGEDLERSTLGLYRSLLWQLQLLLEDQRQKRGNIIENQNFLHEFIISLSPAAQRLIQKEGWHLGLLKEALVKGVCSLRRRSLRIYVDALDECSDDEVADMISFFEELGEYATDADVHLNICFSSRHYPTIVIRHGIEVTLEKQIEHVADMSHYIKSKLNLGSSRQRDTLEQQILDKSQGVFLWVALVIKILNKTCAKGRVDQYKKCLEDIPPGLEKLFEMILLRDEEDIEHLKLCIQWILFASRPLSPSEYFFAVCGQNVADSWNKDEISEDHLRSFVQSSSKGLAEVTHLVFDKQYEGTWAPYSIVQFIHESVRDFFRLREGVLKLWPDTKHNFKAQSEEVLRNRCLLDVMHRRKNPLLDYAEQNVLRHSDKAQGHGSSQSEFLTTFPFESWLRSMHLPPKSSLLYICACLGLPHLTAASSLASSHFDDEPLSPFREAVERRNMAVIQELALAVLPDASSLKGLEDCVMRPHVRSHLEHEKSNESTSSTIKWLRFLLELDHEPMLRAYLEYHEVDLNEGWLKQIETERHGVSFWETVNQVPLQFAKSEAVQALLVSKGAKIGCLGGRSALFHAKSTALILALIDIGIDPNYQDDGGCTALHKAQNAETVQELLLYGADPNISNDEGETALFTAMTKEIARILLDAGADRLIVSDLGQTALHVQVGVDNSQVVGLLLSVSSADVNCADAEGNTPLHVAIKNRSSASMAQLLSLGILDINARDNLGRSAIYYFGEESGESSIAILSRDDVDVNLMDNYGKTALSVHAELGHLSVVNALLQTKRCLVHLVDHMGRTALHWAAAGDFEPTQISIMMTLFRAGTFDPSQRDHMGQTPLDIARWRGHSFMVMALEDELGD